MSSLDSLYTVVHAQFREAFGDPHNVQGGGEQWTLQPDGRYMSAIHVLLNGTSKSPGVWVFDPHDQPGGIVNTPILEARQIGPLIKLIQQRMDFANQGPKSSPPPRAAGPSQAP